MTISNTDPRLQSYRDRLIRLEQERRDRAEETLFAMLTEVMKANG